jgi:hypothetical protein
VRKRVRIEKGEDKSGMVSSLFIKNASEKPRPVDGDESCVCRRQKKTDQMLKQVQHDKMV